MATDIGPRIGVQGEAEFRKAIQNAADNVKAFDAEMKQLTAEFAGNEKSQEALTKKSELLKNEIGAVEKKIAEQEKALKAAREATGDNSSETAQWRTVVAKSKEQLAKLNGELVETETDLKKAGESAKTSSVDFEKIGTVMQGAATAITAAVTAAVAFGTAIFEAAKGVAEFGDNVDKMSQKIGLSAEAYQEWDYVFERSGANIDNLQNGMKTLSNVIVDAANGSASAAEKLNAVGLSAEKLIDLSPDQQLNEVVSALQKMEAGAKRTATATDLFGKSATDMAAVLNMDAEETRALIDEAHNYGMIMSDEAVKASADFEDSLTKLQNTFTGVKNSAVSELLPAITEIMDGFSDLIAGIDGADEKIMNGLDNLFTSLGNAAPKLGEMLAALLKTIVEDGIPKLLTMLSSGLADGLPKLAQTIIDAAIGLLENLADALPDIISGLIDGISNALLVLTKPDNIAKLINAAIEIAAKTIVGLVKNLPKLLAAIIEAIMQEMVGLADAIVDLFTGNFKKTESESYDTGKTIANEINRGFDDNFEDLNILGDRYTRYDAAGNAYRTDDYYRDFNVARPSLRVSDVGANNYQPIINVPAPTIEFNPTMKMNVNGREFATATINDFENVASQRGIGRGGTL